MVGVILQKAQTADIIIVDAPLGPRYIEPMRPSGWLLLSQLSICAALGASAALYVHYLNPADSDFCGPASGCEAVRRSGISYFFGSRFISLPLFALVAFSALLGPVFGAMLRSVSGGASNMTLEHYQTAFEPLLYGVGLAIVLTLFLRETGPAARMAAA